MVTPEWIEGRILRHSEIVFKGYTFPARLNGKASSGFVNGSTRLSKQFLSVESEIVQRAAVEKGLIPGK